MKREITNPDMRPFVAEQSGRNIIMVAALGVLLGIAGDLTIERISHPNQLNSAQYVRQINEGSSTDGAQGLTTNPQEEPNILNFWNINPLEKLQQVLDR